MNKISSEEFRSIYSRVPRLTIEVVIKTDKGIVLTLRSIDPYKGYWHIPGGTLIFRESIEQAVKRIAEEETGLEVKVEKFVGYLEYQNNEEFGGFDHPVGLVFLCRKVSGELRGSFQGEEIAEFTSSPEKIIKDQKDFLVSQNLLTE